MRSTISVDDKGGKDVKDTQENNASIGARFSANNLGAKITQVFSEESAEQAGLSAGDIIIAINDLQVTKSNINKTIESYKTGDELTIHAFRRDELKVFKLVLNEAELTTCYLEANKQASNDQNTRQRNWLNII